MKHTILLKLFGTLILCAAPIASMSAAPVLPATATLLVAPALPNALDADEAGELAVEVNGNTVQVVGGQGLTLEVYDITGKRVTALRIDSNDKRVTLNLRKGCYIIKVGKLTRKVAVS